MTWLELKRKIEAMTEKEQEDVVIQEMTNGCLY